MCGIAGMLSVDGQVEKAYSVVRGIVDSQHRRGPDNQAIESISVDSACLVLGHNRLSVIDLTPQANQPMWDSRHRYCLVYNGEVYNYIELRQELEALGHEFITRSDSEVILEAFKEWGVKAVERFNGPFAFALFDAADNCIYLFRDRFGVKPLYYHFSERTFLFASTGKVIARYLGLKPNLEYLACGLQYYYYDNGDTSPYEGLKSLKPGHFLKVEVNQGKFTADLYEYYNLHERVAALADTLAGKSVPDLVDSVNELLDSAVDIRFRSDVPVGISLSGGLDSSMVAALSASVERGDVTGFTFGHPDDYDTEGPMVKKLSEYTNIRVEYIDPEVGEIIQAFFDTLEAQGAPFPSGSVVAQYLVYKTARAAGVKVLLGGQGGDEVLMGYRKYFAFYLRQLAGVGRYGKAATLAVSLVPMLFAEMGQASVYWRARRRYTGSHGTETLLKLPRVEGLSLGTDPRQPLWGRQERDVMQVSLPTLLRYEDRNSMGNSVESRLPFLDYRLVEFGLALPVTAKLNRGFGKWIVREAVKGKIPEEIRLARYKRGFDVKLSRWIETGLGESIRQSLRSRTRVIEEFVGAKGIDEMFSDHQLIHRPLAFAEATTLFWLGDNL
ncbi:MAG: asparagine synthase (glutamine-hydrolyzing) [Firmicutes bacterium]|nr:asparagine synthase (glutamine-hydrolyzing) [Bacillota bacterium]